MDKVLLLILAAAGLSAVSSHVKRQYHFVYEPTNMSEARSYCREHHTDLVSVDNIVDMENMCKLADKSRLYSLPSYLVWIGLYDDRDSWKWSLADSSFYKHGETDFRRWLDGEPDNAGSKEHCVRMDEDGRWADDNCDDRFHPLCMTSSGHDTTFVSGSTPMTWPEAQSFCRTHHTDLASVKNMTENQRVKSMVPAGQKVWIGLFREPWKWLDGSNSSFRYWREGAPGNEDNPEECAVADFFNSGRWDDWPCKTNFSFVCYSAREMMKVTKKEVTKKEVTKKEVTKKEVIRLKLKTNSSVDLNEDDVGDKILAQLKQKLKDQGVDVDKVKLSWKKQPGGKIFSKQDQKQRKKRSTMRKKMEL